MVFGNWLSIPLGFLMLCWIFLNINILVILEVIDLLDMWKSQSLAGEYFFYSCWLSLGCPKVCHNLKYNHFKTVLYTSHVVSWNWWKSLIEPILLISKKKRHSRQCIKFCTGTLTYICYMFVEIEMLVYCNAKQFLVAAFLTQDFTISQYLVSTGSHLRRLRTTETVL